MLNWPVASRVNSLSSLSKASAADPITIQPKKRKKYLIMGSPREEKNPGLWGPMLLIVLLGYFKSSKWKKKIYFGMIENCTK